MLGAKKILIDIKGSNTDFIKSISGANLAMKGFAATSVASNATATTSAATMAGGVGTSMIVTSTAMGYTGTASELMARSMGQNFDTVALRAAYMGQATGAAATKMALSMKIAWTAVLGGVGLVVVALAAYVLSLGKAVKAASEDQVVIAQTTALLEKQEIAWADVSGEVTNYIEDLERLTTFGDTELQETLNAFLAIGMDVEGALKAMSAATAIANGSNVNLATATKMLSNEYSTGTSRLKQLNLSGESFQETLDNVNNVMGDGSHVTTTLSGKWKQLGNELMNALKPSGEALLPILIDIMDVFIWTARYAVPPLIKVFKLLLAPLRAAHWLFEKIVLSAKAAALAVKLDFAGAMELLKNGEDINDKVRERLTIEEGIVDAIDDQTAGLAEQVALAKPSLSESWKAAGGWISGSGDFVSASEMGISGAATGEDKIGETLKVTEEIAREESKKTDTVISLLREIRDKDWDITVSGGGGFAYSPEDRSSGVI